LLSAEEKASVDLRVKLASAEATAKAAGEDFDYAVETIDSEVSGHMQAIVEVVAEQLSLQLDWNVFVPAARARYEAALRASQAVPMTPGLDAAPDTLLPDLPGDVLPSPPDIPLEAPTLSSELPVVEPPLPSGPPSDTPLPPPEAPDVVPLPPPEAPDVAPLPPPADPVDAPSAPLSAQVGEGSSGKLTSASS
jgi:hypothetical protein